MEVRQGQACAATPKGNAVVNCPEPTGLGVAILALLVGLIIGGFFFARTRRIKDWVAEDKAYIDGLREGFSLGRAFCEFSSRQQAGEALEVVALAAEAAAKRRSPG